jgi:hypothetical protein
VTLPVAAFTNSGAAISSELVSIPASFEASLGEIGLALFCAAPTLML